MTASILKRLLPSATMTALLLAGGGAAAQDRVFTGHVDVADLPITVTAVVVKCSISHLTAGGTRADGEGETSIPTALSEASTRRVSAPFTVRIRNNPAARGYRCQLGFRSAEGVRWASTGSSVCGAQWYCAAAGSVLWKEGSLP